VARTALVLPVADIAAECHQHGVPVLVDGAHVPGSRPLDIAALGMDWYAANLHKWAHAPRSCGFLSAAPERQSILHAPVVSWGRNGGFRREFEHTPTADPTSLLAAPEGIALLREWDFDACVRYMHDLAADAATMLTEHWRIPFEIPCGMVGAMVTVPVPQELGATDADATRLRLALLVDDRIEVGLHAGQGRLWIRVCAQIYNDRSDLERLAEAVARRQ
jgi:isopenicillin-N epimerase